MKNLLAAGILSTFSYGQPININSSTITISASKPTYYSSVQFVQGPPRQNRFMDMFTGYSHSKIQLKNPKSMNRVNKAQENPSTKPTPQSKINPEQPQIQSKIQLSAHPPGFIGSYNNLNSDKPSILKPSNVTPSNSANEIINHINNLNEQLKKLTTQLQALKGQNKANQQPIQDKQNTIMGQSKSLPSNKRVSNYKEQ